MAHEQLIASNPKVNREKLEQAIRMLKELRSFGVPEKGYGLARPFSISDARKSSFFNRADKPSW